MNKTIILVFIVLSLLISFMIGEKNTKTVKVSSDSVKQQEYIDSLISENNMKDIQISRYEYIFDLMDEQLSPDCKNKVDSLMLQTE